MPIIVFCFEFCMVLWLILVFWCSSPKTIELNGGDGLTLENKGYQRHAGEAASGIEAIELDQNGVRKREVPSNNTSDVREKCAANSKEHFHSEPLTNDMADSQVYFLTCSHRDAAGNPCKKCRKRDIFWYEKAGLSHPLDIISRVAFPISYALFVFGYFYYYKMI